MSEIYEVTARSVDKKGISLSQSGKLVPPTHKGSNVSAGWRTVVGKAAKYISFFKKGDKVEAAFDDDGNIIFIKKVEDQSVEEVAAEADKKYNVVHMEEPERLDEFAALKDNPAFFGMIFNQTKEDLRNAYEENECGISRKLTNTKIEQRWLKQFLFNWELALAAKKEIQQK